MPVRFKCSATRELEALNDKLLRRVFGKIEALADQPRPWGCKKLRAACDLWRIRAGDYRVIYSIDDTARNLDIIRIRHRREVYDE